MKKAKFVAISVGQGDAFFLQRQGLTILVDGGRSVEGFPIQFKCVTGRNGVDVLVCTHNDSDHANGILGFLQAGLSCREVWLPSSWADRLDHLLLLPERFTAELISNIEEAEVRPEGRIDLQALGDLYSKREIQRSGVRESVVSNGDFSEESEMATEADAHWEAILSYLPHWAPQVWSSPWNTWLHQVHGDRRRFRLFIEAISAASRIRNIYSAAYHSGALIRWFEYDRKHSGGGIRNLVPLNAREIVQVRRRRWTALEYLALTASNELSLVFLSPRSKIEPAVLFTADSDLSFSEHIPWSKGMIVTAPHHGSEANAYAYKRFINDTSGNIDVVWVRSDGRFFRSRPGNSYLGVYGIRFCTLCRGCRGPRQNVRLKVTSQRWVPFKGIRKCCCV